MFIIRSAFLLSLFLWVCLARISLTQGIIENGYEAFEHKSSLYVLSNTTSNWAEALNMCHNTGGELAAPLNPEIEAAIRIFLTGENVGENVRVWTSGRAWNGEWRWFLPNVPIIYSNFKDVPCAVPTDGHAISMMRSMSGTFGWCKEPLESKLRYVCEYGNVPTMPTTTTTVKSLTGQYDSQTTAPSTGQFGGSSRRNESVHTLVYVLIVYMMWSVNIL